MGTATATRPRARRDGGFRSAAELKEVLELLLERVDADETIGPMLRAARIRVRYEFSDLGVVLNVRSAEHDAERSLEWSFSDDVGWDPKLRLTMSSDVANAHLMGHESLPIAMARGRIRCSCEARSALLFLPAARLLAEPYRELVASDYPHLALRH